MKSTKRFYPIGLLLLSVLMLVACGGGSASEDTTPADNQNTATETVSGDSEAASEESAAEEPAADTPSEPTEIRISYIQQFTDMNPFNTNNQASVAVNEGLFDTLVRVTPDGEIIPWAADSWDISDDNLTITFHLHEGITFSDGTPLNADAVVYSANYFQDPDLFLGTSLLSMTGWEAVDEYTVKFTFSQPDAAALYNLAGPDTSIVSPTAYEALGTDGFGLAPVGSGPYLLEKWEPGVEVIMVKNPNYWQDGVGNFDRVVWRNFQDGAAAVLAAQSGELDLLHQIEPKDVPLYEAIPGWQVGNIESGWHSLVLNTRIPPFDKLENRQALAAALDYDILVNVGFEGFASVPDGLIPPGSWAYQPAGEPMQRDLDRARELLAAAGNPDGFDFKVSVTPQPFRSQLLQMMQASLAEVGINLEIEVNEFARHIEILRQDHNGANAGFVVQQNLHTNPATWLMLYAGCNANVGMTGWCDPNDSTFDDLLAASVATFDTNERIAILHEANVMEMEAMVVLPYVFQQTLHAWNADKLGADYVASFTGGYNYLYIQP